MAPSDEGVSAGAVATPTRVDNIAEKIYQAVDPVIAGEEIIDVIAALDNVKARIQHVSNTQIDAAQIE